jgi:hypothetical protein
MTTVDYSKNDFIDINNQLFRRARNNIGESTAEDIKVDDLSNNEAVKIYGSELINNLKQINYTFEQIEAYVLMPSKLTKENAPKVKQNPDTKMIDLVDVSKLPEPPSVLPKKKRTRDEIIQLLQEIDAGAQKLTEEAYRLSKLKKSKKINKMIKDIEDELERRRKQYQALEDELKELEDEESLSLPDLSVASYDTTPDLVGVDEDLVGIDEFDYSRFNKELDYTVEELEREKERIREAIRRTDEGGGDVYVINENYYADLGYIDGLIRNEKKKRKELPENPEFKQLKQDVASKREALLNGIYQYEPRFNFDEFFLDVRGDERFDKEFRNLKTYLKQNFKGLRQKDIDQTGLDLSINVILEDELKQLTTEKLGKVAQTLPEVPQVITLPKPPPPPKPKPKPEPEFGFSVPTKKVNPIAVEGFLNKGNKEQAIAVMKRLGWSDVDNSLSLQDLKNLLDSNQLTGSGRGRKKKIVEGILSVETDAPPEEYNPDDFAPLPDSQKAQLETNLTDSKDLTKKLRGVKVNPTITLQQYQSKINELIMSLVRFIGKTNVLFITRIKKYLNSLDEEQIQMINIEIKKLKDNYDKIEFYKNYGGQIILQTVLTQLQKETLGLYSEINNIIRNYSKLKDYTIFAGAGLRGGYFIQSDNPFIRGSTTKRFL